MLLQHNTCHAALQSTSLSSVDCHNGPVVRTNYNNMQWCIAVLGFSLRSCCRPLTRCASPLTSFNTAGWVKVRPWCTSGGMDHCYDWGVQTHRTMRSRVALELFEISGLRFAKVWGKRRRGAGGFEPWMINHLSCQWRSLHCCFELDCTVGRTERCFVQWFLESCKCIWQESLMLIQCNMMC